MRKWIIIISVCFAIGHSFDWFWYHEWVKPCKKVSECPVGVSDAQKVAFKSAISPVKIYQGQWVEDIIKVGDYWSVGYLEVKK